MYSMKKYLLLFLCLTLGVAYAQDTLRVRVMTYNLRFGELASLEELAHHIKSFKPDFVALQEVDSKTDRKRTPHQKGKDFISELAAIWQICYWATSTTPSLNWKNWNIRLLPAWLRKKIFR